MLDGDFLEPERLRAFVAVAETGSFTRAAERLRLTQPAISIQVRRLEEAIGYALFVRRSAAAELTQEGEAMLGIARELLQVILRARHQFSQPPLEGTVRLGLIDDFSLTALPDILGHLRERHPRFELFISSGSSDSLVSELDARGLDLALSKRIAGATDGEFIGRQQLVWVGPSGLVQREEGIVPLVLTPAGSVPREVVLSALREAGLRWSVRAETASLIGLRSAVLAGLGISALGLGMIPPGLTPLPQDAELPALPAIEFVLATNPRSRDPVVATFADLLRRIAPLIIGRLTEEQTASIANVSGESSS